MNKGKIMLGSGATGVVRFSRILICVAGLLTCCEAGAVENNSGTADDTMGKIPASSGTFELPADFVPTPEDFIKKEESLDSTGKPPLHFKVVANPRIEAGASFMGTLRGDCRR